MPDNNHKRRACDTCGNDGHESPCEKLKTTATIQDQMFAMLEDIQRENAKQSIHQSQQTVTLATMADILAAWNNTKGFVTTVKTFGSLLLWAAGILTALVLIGHEIREWLIGK